MAFREVTVLEIKEVLRRWLRGETKSGVCCSLLETALPMYQMKQ